MSDSVALTPPSRLPVSIYVLTAGTFLTGTSEFVVAGLLPELAADFDISVAQAGAAITVFAVGMNVGAPSMALLTRSPSVRTADRLPPVVARAGQP